MRAPDALPVREYCSHCDALALDTVDGLCPVGRVIAALEVGDRAEAQAVADDHGLSPQHFRRIVREVAEAAERHEHAARVARACRTLAAVRDRAAEIAAEAARRAAELPAIRAAEVAALDADELTLEDEQAEWRRDWQRDLLPRGAY